MNEDFLRHKIDQRKKEGNDRQLRSSKNLADFVSNDYLGLANNQDLFNRIHIRSQSFPLNGGTGSRLLSGNHPLFEELETFLCSVFKGEACLVFNSGYAANQALVSSVAEKGDTILYDQLAHVCLKEGAWLSKAETVAFRHNDLEDLESRLKRASGRKFVVTETVFSMDGDLAPLKEISRLCERYEAYLIVDEAHSTGSFGEAGSGLLEALGISDQVFGRVYTFGKAMGVHGACVVGSKTLIEYLVNFGRSFIYTTSLPPHSVIAIQESFKYLAENSHLQKDLISKIDFFKSVFSESVSDTAIQPVMIGSNERAREVAKHLQNAGYDIRPILSPTVQRGTERLRISLHTFNANHEIGSMVEVLRGCLEE